MKLLGIIILLISINGFSQSIIKNIYQIQLVANNTGISTYDVNNLILNSDKTFELQYQKYANKKDFKKNIIYEFIVEKGVWKEKDNIIELRINHNDERKEIIYFIHKRNKLFYLSDKSKIKTKILVSKFGWKKVR